MSERVQDFNFMDLSSWYTSCYALGYNGSQKRKYRMFHFLFLTLWNNLLAEVSGIPGYKFNP